MAIRNYMRVVVSNSSNATLRLRHSWTSGAWTPGGWHPEGAPEAGPGTALHWQAEGDTAIAVPITGVEARAWYDVIAPNGAVVGEFYIFANSPLIESIYGNTFHVRTPPGYCAVYVDARGQKSGNRAILDIDFRETRKVAVRDFLPSRNGFVFSNSGGTWSDRLPVVTLGRLWNMLIEGMPDEIAEVLGIARLSEDWGPALTRASQGMCGGMCYAVMDHYNARELPSDMGAPPDTADHPLFLHIRDRLFDSFDMTGKGHRWISYSSPIYPDDDEGVMQTLGLMKGKSWVTYREEWPRIREELDQGRLATIGLVRTDSFDIGENHQVLAYAWQQSGQVATVWIYDPNFPGRDDVTLTFDITDTASPARIVHSASDKTIHALIFCDNYTPRRAPLGRPMPPPDRPKRLAIIEGDGRSITTGGVVTEEGTNACGEPQRAGLWTTRTVQSYVAQVSGYANPLIAWTVGGRQVPAEAGTVEVDHGGVVYMLDTTTAPGGRVLTLSSRSGDSYAVQVGVTVTEGGGPAMGAEVTFEVAGQHEGIKIEDIAAAAQCIVRTIPVPVDIYTIPGKGPGPIERELDREQWGHEMLTRLAADAAIDVETGIKLQSYITTQVTKPEVRAVGRLRLSTGLLRIGG